MTKNSLKKYAQVILNLGVNLQKDQNLQIKGEPVHWTFMRILAEEAYKMGARYVRVAAEHPLMAKIRAENVDDAHLNHVPAFVERDMQMMLDEKWAMIHLGGMEDPHIYNDLPRERHAQIMQAYNQATQTYRNQIVEGGCPWTVADLPTEKWAAQVFGGEPSLEARDKLWQVLENILKLDQDDPVQAWIEQSKILQRRADFLNQKQFDAVHFRGEGTDLTIGLIPKSSWQGGDMKGSHGKKFLPNLPTYEIFTTPDFRKTEGSVRVTRPVMVLGSEVAGAKFTFKNGEVVDFEAESGRENLEQFFKIDQKSRKLGEVALVDCNSPIFQSGHLFHSILLDENAACHIALGSGFPMALHGGDKMTPEELEKTGCNMALQHRDFMIGSAEISVDGLKNGQRESIIRDGKFVI